MRRVVRKRIRHSGDGVDLVADLNVDIAVNVRRPARAAGPDDVPEAERPVGPAPDAPAEGPRIDGTDPEGER